MSGALFDGLFYCHSHASGRAFYYLHSGVNIIGVEVFHFSFGDFFEFGSTYLPRLAYRSFAGTFFHSGGFSQQVGSRGVFILNENVRSS